MSDIKIKIEADISQVPEKLKTVQSELGKTAISAQKSDSSLGKLGAGFTNIASKSGVASSALSSLASTAGGAAGELSSLGSSLLTGGLIAAIPVIITLVQSLGESLFGLSAQQKALNQTVENSVSGFVKANTTIVEMTQKVNLAKEGFASKDQVVKEFNNTIGKTIGFVKSVEEAEALLIAKGPAYIQMMTLKAAANYATAQSGELLARSIITSLKATDGFVGKSIGELSGKLKTQSDTFRDLAADLNKQAIALAQGSGLNVVDIEAPIKAAKEKIVPHLRSINDVLIEMGKQLAFLSAKELNLSTNEARAKIAAIEQAISELIKKFGLNGGSKLVLKLFAEINFIKQGEIRKDFISPEKILAEDLRNPIDVDITVQPNVKFLPAKNLEEEGAKLRDAIGNEIALTTSVVSSALDAMTSAVQAASEGKNVFGAFFGTLLKSLGSGISALGKQMLLAAITIQIAKKSLGKLTGVGAAIALIAVGALIQFASSKIQQATFASGVRSFGGGYALVGERGPERVFLPQGSSVQPNNELNAFSGSNGGFIAETRIQGQDLVIALRRAENTMSRNN